MSLTKYKNKDWLYQKYIKEKWSACKIGKFCDVTHSTIHYYLQKFNILKRTRIEAIQLLRGKNSPHWKGKRIGQHGYVLVYRPGHPCARKCGHVLEHRLIIEKQIERHLFPWEIVHHINGIRDDNRIENLELLPAEKHNLKTQELHKENQFLKERLAQFLAL